MTSKLQLHFHEPNGTTIILDGERLGYAEGEEGLFAILGERLGFEVETTNDMDDGELYSID